MAATDYSVLMSVYFKETPDYLEQSIKSVLCQTLKTNDFIIVIDGPVTDELSAVLTKYKDLYPETIKLIKLDQNMGLGKALNEGLRQCKNEIIARQDSDDISLPDRMEKQINLIFETNADIISGTVSEFIDSPENKKGERKLPSNNSEIIKFSRKRNPFNHPAVMFHKKSVIDAGGYNEEFHLFEDYYLWVRMLKNGAVGSNIDDILVYMRVDDNTMMRRGGRKYASDMLRFHKWLKSSGWSSNFDYLTGAIPHAIICIIPNKIRGLIYKFLH